MEAKKYLPLGSVVLLKGGQHRLMIVGFCISSEETNGKIYDYLGCFFPEGIFTSENSLVFNHGDIDKIYYMGYSDKEEKEFKRKLNHAVDKYIGEDGKLNSSPINMMNDPEFKKEEE